MHNVRSIFPDFFYLGVSDRRLALFESAFPIPHGVSYNSYLITDEHTVLIDTVDRAVSERFLENLEYALNGRKLDYLIVSHMEPDHCSGISEIVYRFPEVKIVANKKTLALIKQFFDFDIDRHYLEVKEGETLSTGRHTFSFFMAPMVHWPEVMVTYDSYYKVLFSADAFGTFGALNGNIFADEVHFDTEWLPEARRYYTNIVGKYGTQVQSLLKKASALNINMLCPLHGPIWRKNINYLINKYKLWSDYIPEETSVMIAYASVYGNTAGAVEILASLLAQKGVKNIAIYDVSVTHHSIIVAEAFRCSHLVFASTTYNAGMFLSMETVLLDLKAHNLKNRTVAFIENGSWASSAGNLMRNILAPLPGTVILEETVSIHSSIKSEQLEDLQRLADSIYKSFLQPSPKPDALTRLSYGMFLISSIESGRDNACIINTAQQVTNSPNRILVSINKKSYTHDMIMKIGEFNISVLTKDAPFELFERFGFKSGREADKFRDFDLTGRTDNGIIYLKEYSNAIISGKVIKTEDMGTHTVFYADVASTLVLSDAPSMTYNYYFSHVKPASPAPPPESNGYICKICGYIYKGEPLPDDFICPLCGHGANDFEKL